MTKINLFCVLLLSVVMGMSVTGCKRRPQAARTTDGVTPVAGMHSDDIYGVGLGPRMDGEFVEGLFQAVHFEFDSSQISPSERFKLEEVAAHMRRNTSDNLIIEGHTDERGSKEYNLSLGERRALAARAYLVGLGIDGSRIQTLSFGEERPVAFEQNEEAWRQNRRAEFLVSQ